jgi:hypothetical protein
MGQRLTSNSNLHPSPLTPHPSPLTPRPVTPHRSSHIDQSEAHPKPYPDNGVRPELWTNPKPYPDKGHETWPLTTATTALVARPFEIPIAISKGVVLFLIPSFTVPSGSVILMGSLGSFALRVRGGQVGVVMTRQAECE